ncbi:MAG: pyridoxal-phosphate dependent enzyme, partial [Candidatus Kariarchaeaceae archaeon]
TSGNTGLGLALIGIDRGYDVILVMPDKMSPEKMNLVKAMGCEVVVCPTEVEPDDPRSYYSVSKRLASEIEGAFLANQYFNPANPIAHYQTTGPEIWEQTEGKITHFFCGVGTGGTISGTGKYLKEKNPNIKIIGIDPFGSILAHYHKNRNEDIEAKSYKIEGVGEDIIPSTVDFDIIDEFVTVNDKEAFDLTHRLAKEEGMMVGGSSGMAAAGAVKYLSENAKQSDFGVVLLPDTGERYLGKVFSKSWLSSNGFLPPPESILELLGSKSANLPDLITIELDSTIDYTIGKMKKFDIDQVLILRPEPLILSKKEIFRALLSKTSPTEPVSILQMTPITTLDLKSDLDDLISKLKQVDQVLIMDEDEPYGFVSREDIFNNFPVEVLISY